MIVTNFNPFPIITTERLVLRRVEETDVDEMFVMRSDPRILPHRSPCQSKAEALHFIRKINNDQSNGESITWAVTLKEMPILIGTICYWNVKKEQDRAEIGYALHPDFHRRGIMNEALKPVINYGFRDIKLHSIEADVDPNNLASVRLLERHHFIREGYFKENFKLPNGVFVDTAVYSLLAS